MVSKGNIETIFKVCSKRIKPTGKNHKMCRECWNEYRRKYKTEKQREYRKKQSCGHF